MANPEHQRWLGMGVTAWNLRSKVFRATGGGADLSGANLDGMTLRRADFRRARLDGACLHGANLRRTDFRNASLVDADLRDADLGGTSLYNADLRGAKLGGASLRRAVLVNTDLRGANLTGCKVFGIAAWNLKVDGAIQVNLVITPRETSEVTVDNLDVAQFVYVLLTNPKLRGVIDTVSTKVVLILGRFTDERLRVLDAMREALRQRGLVPVLFDFDPPVRRDLTETVSALAHLARFVVADLTDAKAIPQELSHIVPFLPSVPVQPLILDSEREYGLFEHWERYPWVLPTYRYRDLETLLAALDEQVIDPAEARAEELAPLKRRMR